MVAYSWAWSLDEVVAVVLASLLVSASALRVLDVSSNEISKLPAAGKKYVQVGVQTAGQPMEVHVLAAVAVKLTVSVSVSMAMAVAMAAAITVAVAQWVVEARAAMAEAREGD